MKRASRGASRGGRAPKRGRRTVALALLVFLAVAVSVVWRRTEGLSRARTLQQMASEQRALETRRAQLERDIISQSSLSRLGTQAQSRLGMRFPDDSQVIFLPRPSPRDR